MVVRWSRKNHYGRLHGDLKVKRQVALWHLIVLPIIKVKRSIPVDGLKFFFALFEGLGTEF